MGTHTQNWIADRGDEIEKLVSMTVEQEVAYVEDLARKVLDIGALSAEAHDLTAMMVALGANVRPKPESYARGAALTKLLLALKTGVICMQGFIEQQLGLLGIKIPRGLNEPEDFEAAIRGIELAEAADNQKKEEEGECSTFSTGSKESSPEGEGSLLSVLVTKTSPRPLQ
jgi:hypothetical protein